MASPEFFQTSMGHRFFESTMPELVRQLGRLNDNLGSRAGAAEPTSSASDDMPDGPTPAAPDPITTALLVLVTTPAIRAFLLAGDVKALGQAERALRAEGEIVDCGCLSRARIAAPSCVSCEGRGFTLGTRS